MEYTNVYGITEENVEMLEKIVEFYAYHNANFTGEQMLVFYTLQAIVEKIRDRFTGYDIKEI